VEWAASVELATSRFKRHAALNHIDNVDSIQQLLDESLGNTIAHGLGLRLIRTPGNHRRLQRAAAQ
jgi:hypothetical protein